MSGARFKIRNVTLDGAWSPFDDGDFDCNPGDELALQLEDTPALDIWQAVYTCEDRSNGRTVPTFDPETGEADPPTSIVSLTMPADERGNWQIQSQTNGGASARDAQGRPDLTVHTKTRHVIVRTENLSLRHILAAELVEDPTAAAVALQEMLDAVDEGGGGGGTAGVEYRQHSRGLIAETCEETIVSIGQNSASTDLGDYIDPHVFEFDFDVDWPDDIVPTIHGTDRAGASLTEAITPPVGGGVVKGTKVFSTAATVTLSGATAGSSFCHLRYRNVICVPDKPVDAFVRVVSGGSTRTIASSSLTEGWVEPAGTTITVFDLVLVLYNFQPVIT